MLSMALFVLCGRVEGCCIDCNAFRAYSIDYVAFSREHLLTSSLESRVVEISVEKLTDSRYALKTDNKTCQAKLPPYSEELEEEV